MILFYLFKIAEWERFKKVTKNFFERIRNVHICLFSEAEKFFPKSAKPFSISVFYIVFKRRKGFVSLAFMRLIPK
jgi:hypothetical protein